MQRHYYSHGAHALPPPPPVPHSTDPSAVSEAINLLRNLESYGASSDEEVGELIAWFLQAEYGNAHECRKSHHEIRHHLKHALAIRRVPSQAFVFWKEYVGTLQTTALTLFIAGVNRKFNDQLDNGVFSF